MNARIPRRAKGSASEQCGSNFAALRPAVKVILEERIVRRKAGRLSSPGLDRMVCLPGCPTLTGAAAGSGSARMTSATAGSTCARGSCACSCSGSRSRAAGTRSPAGTHGSIRARSTCASGSGCPTRVAEVARGSCGACAAIAKGSCARGPGSAGSTSHCTGVVGGGGAALIASAGTVVRAIACPCIIAGATRQHHSKRTGK